MSMYYSRRHYERLSNGGPDTAETVSERVRHRAACEQAHRETLERFQGITPENAAEAIAWQTKRIEELTREESWRGPKVETTR